VPPITSPGSVLATDLSVAIEDVRIVEACMANAWPPTMSTTLGGWHFRHSPGVSNRRGNSVLPIFGVESEDFLDHINTVERFYNTRNLPSRFMVSPASVPGNLDQLLASQGYFVDAPTWVQWADTDVVMKSIGAVDGVELIEAPTQSWMSVYMEGIDDEKKIALKADFIKRIKSDLILAQISDQSGPVAVGLGVRELGWSGIFCMHTLKPHRRQGYARRILAALADWAWVKDAKRLYLQVEQDNPTAQKFYQASGFQTQYGYHYRTKEIPRANRPR
jgi:GNAT superfamily N-acetyltransferase